MKYKLLLAVFIGSLVAYLLTNFQIFPASKILFGLITLVISLVTFLIGVVSIISISIKFLRKKKVGLFERDAALSAIYITLFCFLVLPIIAPYRLPEGSYDMKFDQQVWKQEETSTFSKTGYTLRQKMIGDVIKNIIANKNRQEVLEILGPPTDTDKWQSMKSDHLIYVLGPDRGFMPIDYEWLFVQFEGEKFKRASIGTD